MKKLFEIIKNRIFIGLITLLPLIILMYIINFVYQFFYDISYPIVDIFSISSSAIHSLIALSIFLIFCILLFLVGVAMKTAIGRESSKFVETVILNKIPGYVMLKESVEKFKNTNASGSIFSKVALVDLHENTILMGGFVTDESEKHYTVYIPVAPNITSGFIYHVEKKWVIKLEDCSSEEMIKTLVSCGCGSSNILNRSVSNEKFI